MAPRGRRGVRRGRPRGVAGTSRDGTQQPLSPERVEPVAAEVDDTAQNLPPPPPVETAPSAMERMMERMFQQQLEFQRQADSQQRQMFEFQREADSQQRQMIRELVLGLSQQQQQSQPQVGRFHPGASSSFSGLRGTLSDFLGVFRSTFSGSTDPLEADSYFRQLEQFLESLCCPADMWVRFASHTLTGEAAHWWEAHSRVLEQPVLFSTFKAAFYDRWFGSESRKTMFRAFLDLRQGSRSVDEYLAEFTRLSRFVPDSFQSDEVYVDHFKFGLRSELRLHCDHSWLKTLRDVTQRAREVERNLNRDRKAAARSSPTPLALHPQRAIQKPPVPRLSAGPAIRQPRPIQQDSQFVTQPVTCFGCGQVGHRVSVCPTVPRCFTCGQTGHLARACPLFFQSGQAPRFPASQQFPVPPSTQPVVPSSSSRPQRRSVSASGGQLASTQKPSGSARTFALSAKEAPIAGKIYFTCFVHL